MKKVKFEFDKMVSYWKNEKGAFVNIDGETDFSSWSSDVSSLNVERHVNENETMEEILKDVLEKSYLPNSYFIITDEGRISFNCIEDNDSNLIETIEEQKQKEENGEQLFICDYSVFVEVQEVYIPTTDELKEFFPSAEY